MPDVCSFAAAATATVAAFFRELSIGLLGYPGMKRFFASAWQYFRARVDGEDSRGDDSSSTAASDNPFLRLLRSLKVIQSFGNRLPISPLCRCAVSGPYVEEVYGCHAHLYPTESPADSHGNAFAWSVTRTPLSTLSLLSLCRLGNSCRKNVAVVSEEHSTCLVLSYEAEL